MEMQPAYRVEAMRRLYRANLAEEEMPLLESMQAGRVIYAGRL